MSHVTIYRFLSGKGLYKGKLEEIANFFWRELNKHVLLSDDDRYLFSAAVKVKHGAIVPSNDVTTVR